MQTSQEKMNYSINKAMFLASEMKKGLKEEQFEVWFQPQVNHAYDGSLIGAEALVRWRHPQLSFISPADFIPLFEEYGLIYDLDKYVWEHTCAYIRRGIEEGIPPIPVSVNVSRYDMMQDDFMETITSILDEQKIPYDLIHLEVTESAFADDTGKVSNIVNELFRRGFTIAIDDFGSGYSSLSLLRNVSAHMVKLDMRFFGDGKNQARNECILESIIRMVTMLGMAVLSEGVEQVEQANLLRSHGCAYIQGYLYSKPLPYDEFYTYIKSATSKKINHDCTKAYKENEVSTIETQDLFRNIIAGTEEVVIIFDNNTKQLLYANRAAEQYFGKRFDPINSTTCMDYCEHLERCKKCPAKFMQANERREFSTSDKDKRLKTLYVQMNWNGHDAVAYYQTDITTQVQELEFSDALIHNMPGATVAFELDKDEKPKIKHFSENAKKTLQMSGLDTTSLSYEDFLKIIHTEDCERIKNAAYNLFSNKIPFRESFRVMLTNGNIIWLEALVNPVADRNGSYLFYGIYTDITEQKNAQEHMEKLLQSIPAAITIYEVSNSGINRIFISDTAKEVLMFTDDNHEKHAVDDLYSRVYEDDRQRVKTITQECFKECKKFTIQFRIVSEKGLIRWVQIDSNPIKDENKEDTYLFYSTYKDITEQKQLEENLGSSGDRQFVERTINFGLQEAAKQTTAELSVEYIIRFVGKVLHGERAYIFEKNPDHTDSNTYEWVADGITPEKENLQNLPEELSRPWYDEFKKQKLVVIENMEDIKDSSPDLYEALTVQNIQSLIVAPLFDMYGNPMGFFGIDNPPKELLSRNTKLIQTIAFYLEAAIKRKNLNANEKAE